MQWIVLGYIIILGLIIGSFLNVVILRLPKMLQRQWHEECVTFLAENTDPVIEPKSFNLMPPRSRCPQCKHPLSLRDNIPLISFLSLKAQCRYCQAPISWRYPLVEFLTVIFSFFTAMHFGFTLMTLFALILTWGLIALAGVDFDHHLLPDDITLPFLWFGLILNLNTFFTDIHSAVIGAIAGYLFLWSIYWIFKLLAKKEGMGYGDFKLAAMLGAWLGWQALPGIILIASLLGTLVAGLLILLKQHSRTTPIPFGPFLGLAGWISLNWGDKITHLYLEYARLI